MADTQFLKDNLVGFVPNIISDKIFSNRSLAFCQTIGSDFILNEKETKEILIGNITLNSSEILQEAVSVILATLDDLHKNISECDKSGDTKESLRVEYPDDLHAVFNGKTYRLQTNGYYERREYLHTAVVEYYTGEKIPEGYVVHHAKKNIKGEYKNHVLRHEKVVERECKTCGEKFLTDRYIKRKYCDKHYHAMESKRKPVQKNPTNSSVEPTDE